MIAVLGGLILALMSLNVTRGYPAQADQVLMKRAHAFWDAVAREDWTALYQYMPPSSRTQISLDQFTASNKKKSTFHYLSFKLKKAETDGDLGWVKLVLTTEVKDLPSIPPVTTEKWEQWQKIDGNWFPIPHKRREEAPSRPPSVRSRAEEAALAKRVDEFWDAMEKEQYGLIYEFLDPEFRKGISQEEFSKKKAKSLYVAHTVQWAEVTGNLGKVRIAYLSHPNDPYVSKAEPQGSTIVQDWIKINGVWYQTVAAKKKQEAE